MDTVEARHAMFTSFVMPVDGVLGSETRVFLNLTCGRNPIFKVTNLCHHGSRIKSRRVMDINDGAGFLGYID